MQQKAALLLFICSLLNRSRRWGPGQLLVPLTSGLMGKLVSAGLHSCACAGFAAKALVAHWPRTSNEGPGERGGLSWKAAGPFLRCLHSLQLKVDAHPGSFPPGGCVDSLPG